MIGLDRLEQIVNAGMDQARAGGLNSVTITNVARAVGISHPLVLHYTETAAGLRELIALAAIEREDLPIIADLIVSKHPLAANIPPAVKMKALQAVIG